MSLTILAVLAFNPAQARGPTHIRSLDGRLLALSGDLGLGGLAGQALTTLQAGLDMREGELALGFFGRVRLGLDGDQTGQVRDRDFDEPSDYVHILRYLQYRRAFGGVQLQARAGEVLGFTLGKGTLVADYSNIADMDHPHTGLQLSLDAGELGFEALIDNVVQPAVLATRAAWRPRALEGFELGASLVLDPRAVRRVALDPSGQRQIDSAFNLQGENEVLVLSGLEASYRLGGAMDARLTPYAAVNTSWYGLGLHVGSVGYWPISDSGVELMGQVEYRLSSGGYAPGYISTFYDIERYQASLSFSDPELATAKQRATPLENLHAGNYGGQGSLAQLGIDAGRIVQFKLGHSWHPGPLQHRLWLRGATEPSDTLSLGWMALLTGIGADAQGADGLAILVEARYRLSDNLYLLTQYLRTWVLDANTRYYAPLQGFNIALGGNWSG